MNAVKSDIIIYCPYCSWNLESGLFFGNNGVVRKYWCSHCGLMYGEDLL